MNPVPRIVIDPFLLCLHNACASKEAFETFAKRLESWSGVIESDKVSLLISERCVSALIQTGSYPFTHTIDDAVRRFGLTHISSDFLDKIAQWMLELRPYFEDAINTDEIIATDANTRICPDIYLSRLTIEHGIPFRDTLVSAAHWASNPDRTFEVIVGTASTAGIGAETIEVSAIIDGYLRRDEELVEYTPPKPIIEDLVCIFDCNQLIAAHSAIEVWNRAETQVDVCRAFEFRVKEHQSHGLSPEAKVKCLHLSQCKEWQELLPTANTRSNMLWMIGEKFLDSIHIWNFGIVEKQAELLIDACSRILLNSPKESIEEFRVSKDSKKQKQRADGALAWRTHLSKDGIAYRLLFWTHENGVIEFANVANKAECKIY